MLGTWGCLGRSVRGTGGQRRLGTRMRCAERRLHFYLCGILPCMSRRREGGVVYLPSEGVWLLPHTAVYVLRQEDC